MEACRADEPAAEAAAARHVTVEAVVRDGPRVLEALPGDVAARPAEPEAARRVEVQAARRVEVQVARRVEVQVVRHAAARAAHLLARSAAEPSAASGLPAPFAADRPAPRRKTWAQHVQIAKERMRRLRAVSISACSCPSFDFDGWSVSKAH